jgi:hypothetical protein
VKRIRDPCNLYLRTFSIFRFNLLSTVSSSTTEMEIELAGLHFSSTRHRIVVELELINALKIVIQSANKPIFYIDFYSFASLSTLS